MSSGITSEAEISQVVLRILSDTDGGDASLGYLRKRIPILIKLSGDDTAQSDTRPNEQMWEQRLRNIKSHHGTPGNYIAEGYLLAPSRGRLRITDAGRKRIA